MKQPGLLLLTPFILSLSAAALAASEALFRGSLCDSNDRVCLQARIDFDPNRKLMEIHGRLYRTAGEGSLTFQFAGETPRGEHVFHSTTVEVQGQYNEGLSHKFGPPYSNRTEWSLSRVTFSPRQGI